MVRIEPEGLEDVSGPRGHKVRSLGEVRLQVRRLDDMGAITCSCSSSRRGTVSRGRHEQHVVEFLEGAGHAHPVVVEGRLAVAVVGEVDSYVSRYIN